MAPFVHRLRATGRRKQLTWKGIERSLKVVENRREEKEVEPLQTNFGDMFPRLQRLSGLGDIASTSAPVLEVRTATV